jgi:hypothetical protein
VHSSWCGRSWTKAKLSPCWRKTTLLARSHNRYPYPKICTCQNRFLSPPPQPAKLSSARVSSYRPSVPAYAMVTRHKRQETLCRVEDLSMHCLAPNTSCRLSKNSAAVARKLVAWQTARMAFGRDSGTWDHAITLVKEVGWTSSEHIHEICI